MCRRPLWLRVRNLEGLKSFVRIFWTDNNVTSYLILAAEGVLAKDSNPSLIVICLSMLAKTRSETVKERKEKNSTTSSSEEKRSPERLASVVEVRDFALMAV